MQNAIAVISDIHSNFEALTAVLDDVRSQEVGWTPFSNQQELKISYGMRV